MRKGTSKGIIKKAKTNANMDMERCGTLWNARIHRINFAVI